MAIAVPGATVTMFDLISIRERPAPQIDPTGLANVSTPHDCLRFGMGGRNIKANYISFYALPLGATLAHDEGETATASNYTELAPQIQEVAVLLPHPRRRT
ncbi:hypothetical protein BC628DRAFT_1420211 [Trametes gibbosa]|nr:hypothetical protein BC628DRAFT_1420211 [Trametes gibbosa]